MIKSIIQLLKPSHYLKNLFVFLPLFFSAHFTRVELLWQAFLAFASFCLIASSVYIFNDLIDAKEDRIHPDKKDRPIAARQIKATTAGLLDIVLTLSGIAIALSINMSLVWVLIIYKFTNILYTLFLKKIAIIDVMVLSIGFVLRLFAGSVSTQVVLSVWIIIMTFLLSLLIVLGKRRLDVLFFEQKEIELRKVVAGYNRIFLDYSMVMLSSVTIVAYIMYSISPESTSRFGTNYLFVTAFWVVAGILRYLQLIFVEKTNRTPVQLLIRDHPLKFILLAWLFNFLYFIYLN